MKFSTATIFCTLAAGASAFAPSKQNSTPLTQTSMSSRSDDDKSQAIPFQKRPHMLDGSMPGDVGFDPMGLASTPEKLMFYREAEIKHGRIAMLAAAGWPLAELFDRKIANIFDAEVMVDASNRNPALLNGGLGKISPLYWIGCLVAAAAIDLKQNELAEKNPPGYFPGNLSWDPLNLYPEDEAGQRRMQTAEIKNGRLAMIAITAFAFQEFVQDYAVINQTPIFFQPVQDVVDLYGQSGQLSPQF